MDDLILTTLLDLIVGRTGKDAPMDDEQFFRNVELVRGMIRKRQSAVSPATPLDMRTCAEAGR